MSRSVWKESEFARAVGVPSDGPMARILVVPKRHIGSFWALSVAEREALWALAQDIETSRQDSAHVRTWMVRSYPEDSHTPGHCMLEWMLESPPPPSRESDRTLAGGAKAVMTPENRHRRLAAGGKSDPFAAHILPLFAESNAISIVASFVMESGLNVLESPILSALKRGARVRILTGDYLQITQVGALRRLLDWAIPIGITPPEGLESEDAEEQKNEQSPPLAKQVFSDLGARLDARIIEVSRHTHDFSTFHPKSWRFENPTRGVAYVGSSNLSMAALKTGAEWNLRIERESDPEAWHAIVSSYERLWALAQPLTDAWIRGYAERVQANQQKLAALAFDAADLDAPLPEPTVLQEEALEQLQLSRDQGHTRALVVMATGLGKTWLAAFDVQAFQRAFPGANRVLILAHRYELLQQAAQTIRRLRPEAAFGWCLGDVSRLEGDFVFASVQKLSRPDILNTLAPDAFSYVIVDEVHHAAAPSYQRILARLQPRFLLGLTATPDRADEADIRGLFDDHVPFHADLGEGIDRGLLAPFSYYGLKDTTDYAQIPWRNSRFDPQILSQAVQTHERMETLWRAWTDHPGKHTLIFCCSIAHAHFVTDWLSARGVRVVCVYAGTGSADRDDSISKLKQGALDAICSVDLLNEGVDIPCLDRVVMLRPTESGVIFLQQLGRGLRLSPGKACLTVIDFVGNHRAFLERMRLLLSLAGGTPSISGWLEGKEPANLPAGCSVVAQLEAIGLLQRLLPKGSGDRIVQAYRELKVARAQRPTAWELAFLGFDPKRLPRSLGGWFSFVHAEGDLSADEQRAWQESSAFLSYIEQIPDSEVYLLALIQLLLESDTLGTGCTLDILTTRLPGTLERMSGLIPAALRTIQGEDDASSSKGRAAELVSLVLSHWSQRVSVSSFFTLDQGMLTPTGSILASAENVGALSRLTAELVMYRVGVARLKLEAESKGQGFLATVSLKDGDPILRLPDRKQHPTLPLGTTAVYLESGARWQLEFLVHTCERAHVAGNERNQLPDLLRSWFGMRAGAPATCNQVRFYVSPDGWWIEPISEARSEPEPLLSIPCYPSLHAAAGAIGTERMDAPDMERVRLPIATGADALFAVRASGISMEGGDDPLLDGDWVVLKWARELGFGSVEGRIVLVALGDPHVGQSYHLKRIRRREGTYWLDSDNPDVSSFPAPADTRVLALKTRHVRPEALAPAVGTPLSMDDVCSSFQLSTPPRAPYSRIDGHLFILLETPGSCVSHTTFQQAVPSLGPGETAFVLARTGSSAPWRYCGVGRFSAGLWHIPELDFATWKHLGVRPDRTSRLLPEDKRAEATVLLEKLIQTLGTEAWVEVPGRRFRLLGLSRSGGARIDRGPEDTHPRSISLTDLGWVLQARALLRDERTTLDEAWVNRRRYLEGTPKAATRYIDTGWALRLIQVAESLGLL